jgi:SAM-dependent methyltransferase
VGIDNDASTVESAQALAAESGRSNIRFETANIYELPFPDGSFDAAFSHAVLSHLGDPLAALKEIRRVLKPGGVIGVRDGDADGFLIAPPNPLLLQSYHLYWRLVEHNGGRWPSGKHLRALLRETGYSRVGASASYECFGNPEMTREWGEAVASRLLEPSMVDQVTKLGWADRETLENIGAAWRAWGENLDAFHAVCWCEAVGWKE